MNEEDNNADDEIITVRLPRKDANMIRQMIKERQAMDYIKGWLSTWWVWAVAGGVLFVWSIWDKFKIGIH